jgi:perosamine synthetase
MIRWDEADIGPDERKLVLEVLDSGYVGGNGPFVRRFEAEFAKKIGVRHAMAVSNGTSALLCALYAFRDEMKDPTVSVASFTFIASVNTASEVFRKVVLADCGRSTWNVERDLVPKKSDLILPVDVGGLPVDYDSLKEFGVPILADSAESAGGRYKGKPVGSQADVHIFSFHRAKIMTTGEGGMITTDNDSLYERMRAIGNHGYDEKRKPWEYKHSRRAFNFRMTELQAAIGIAQLGKLDRYVEERRKKARIYKEIIGQSVVYQDEPPDRVHPYFFFGVLVPRELGRFCSLMLKSSIEVKTWTPAHLQEPYTSLGLKLPNSEYVAKHLVLLPIHNRLRYEQVEQVARAVRTTLRRLS